MTQATQTKPEMKLWLSDTRGRYIPRDFARSFSDRANSVHGVSDAEWKVLEDGPDVEDDDVSEYWEVWDDVLRDAVVSILGEGTFTLHQDGDLWLVPDGMEWDDAFDTFVWPLVNEEFGQ